MNTIMVVLSEVKTSTCKFIVKFQFLVVGRGFFFFVVVVFMS